MTTNSRIYTESDNKDLAAVIEDRIKKTRLAMEHIEQIGQGAITFNTSDAATTPRILPRIVFYVAKKGNKKLSLEHLQVAPSSTTALSRNFDVVYRQQFDAILFTKEEEVNFNSVTGLMACYDYAIANNSKVYLTSSKYVSKLKTICHVLTQFFNDNRQVISSIATMINNRVETPIV